MHGDVGQTQQTHREIDLFACSHRPFDLRESPRREILHGQREVAGIHDREEELAVSIGDRVDRLDPLRNADAAFLTELVLGAEHLELFGLVVQDHVLADRRDAIGQEHGAANPAGRLQPQIDLDGLVGLGDVALDGDWIGTKLPERTQCEITDPKTTERILAGREIGIDDLVVRNVAERDANLATGHDQLFAREANPCLERRLPVIVEHHAANDAAAAAEFEVTLEDLLVVLQNHFANIAVTEVG